MKNMRRLYSIPYFFWLLFFVIAPVILIVYQSFFDMNGITSLPLAYLPDPPYLPFATSKNPQLFLD